MAIHVASLTHRASPKNPDGPSALGSRSLADRQVGDFLFEFFDVERQGRIGIAEVEGALKRLVNIAQAHTRGKFLEAVNLGAQGPERSEDEALGTLAADVLREMGAAGTSSGPVTRSAFDAWLASETDSAKAVVLLFHTMGVSIAGAPGWDPAR